MFDSSIDKLRNWFVLDKLVSVHLELKLLSLVKKSRIDPFGVQVLLVHAGSKEFVTCHFAMVLIKDAVVFMT